MRGREELAEGETGTKGPLSDLRAKPAFVACSDLHLSLDPPACRGETRTEWLDAQARYLGQVDDVARSLGVPVVIAGDLFDRWNSPAELINFAIKNIPRNSYAICGQHDLPNHSYDQRRRSAYWTLVEAGVVHHLFAPPTERKQTIARFDRATFYGYPWGFNPEPIEKKDDDGYLRVAVVHAYCWFRDQKVPQAATPDNNTSAWWPRLRGYDVVITGDNHLPFNVVGPNGEKLINCGGFLRRRSDEYSHRPKFYVVHYDGRVKPAEIDVSKDKFDLDAPEKPDEEELGEDVSGVVTAFRKMKDAKTNFQSAMRYMANGVKDERTRKVVLQIVEESEK